MDRHEPQVGDKWKGEVEGRGKQHYGRAKLKRRLTMANTRSLRTGGITERGWGINPFLSFRDIDRLFEDILSATSLTPSQNGNPGGVLMPRLDVSETNKELRIKAELPGVSEKDVEVTLNDDLLVIRGDKKFERQEDRENYHFAERAYGTFQRTLRLPFEADPSKIQARLENGVLTVIIPKDEKQEAAHRIEVQPPALPGTVNNGKGQSSASGSSTADGSSTKS
jgi:HSP20 family protein